VSLLLLLERRHDGGNVLLDTLDVLCVFVGREKNVCRVCRVCDESESVKSQVSQD
jgi:hypothetical protein